MTLTATFPPEMECKLRERASQLMRLDRMLLAEALGNPQE